MSNAATAFCGSISAVFNKRLLAASASVLVMASGAVAQEASEQDGGDDPSYKMNTVTVTAQRREQALVDVPISISAVTGDKVADSGVTNVEDMQYLVPGLQFSHDRTGELRVSIRGISSNVGLESAVAVHQDGTYLSQKLDQSRAFFDVARVEVLRGPQGTLYGRNATGGAINIITNDPTDTPEGGLRLNVGNYGLIEGEGYASGPLLGEGVQGRIAASFRNLDGYGTNAFNNESVNGEQATAVRAKLKIAASERTDILLSADYSDTSSSYDDQVSRLFADTPLSTEAADSSFVPPTGFDTNTNYPDFQDTEIWGASGKITVDLGGVELSSLTSYRSLERNTGIDIDGSPQDRAFFRSGRSGNEQISQEITLGSSGDGALDWILGAFYFNNSYDSAREVPLALFGATILSGTNHYDTEAYAVFGEAEMAFTDRLSVILGGRYSYESQDLEDYRYFGTTQGTISGDGNWDAFTPKVAAIFDLTDTVNVYATYSKGFKSGGFNPGTFLGESFNPEVVSNYELGIKGASPNHFLTGSLSAFYMDYTDLQVNTLVLRDGVPAIRVVNAAAATIQGFEGEFAVQPTDWFAFDGSVSYLDAVYDEFLAADNITFSNIDVSGNKMFDVPELAGTLGATFVQQVSDDWEVTFRTDIYYQGKTYFTPFEDMRGSSQDAYTLVNARLAFTNAENGWEVAIFGRNLTDELVASRMSEANDAPFTGLFRSTNYRSPRTYGLSLSHKF